MAEKSIVKVDKAKAAQRIKAIVPILKKTYPDARTSLDHANALELLIATILAAQCTDARVNIVTKDLFKKYKSAHDWEKPPSSRLNRISKAQVFIKIKLLA